MASDQIKMNIARTAYLHEAGHAIVAITCGLDVRQITCDGETGFCEAELSHEANKKLHEILKNNPKITSTETLKQIVNANIGKLTTLLGGIAGESLESNMPISCMRRSSDDLSKFFGFLASMSRNLSAQDFDPIWGPTFQKAQDLAWNIIKERRTDTEKLADALQHTGALTGQEVVEILKS